MINMYINPHIFLERNHTGATFMIKLKFSIINQQLKKYFSYTFQTHKFIVI